MLNLRNRVLIWCTAVLSATVFAAAATIMIFVSLDISETERKTFYQTCADYDGIAIESRGALHRWPSLYCVQSKMIIDETSGTPPKMLK